jgi:hypothetical protein
MLVHEPQPVRGRFHLLLVYFTGLYNLQPNQLHHANPSLFNSRVCNAWPSCAACFRRSTNEEELQLKARQGRPLTMRISAHRKVIAQSPPDRSNLPSYGLIGNMRTAALVSSEDASIDHLCWPDFDSPSVFIRLLDKDKGGHFEACPSNETTQKQSYSGNILVTKFLSEEGVSHVTDFMPLPDPKVKNSPFYPWLIRRLECIRGEVVFNVECFPAFDYARAKHTTKFVDDGYGRRVLFESPDFGLSFELLWTCDEVDEAPRPKIDFSSLSTFFIDFRNRGSVSQRSPGTRGMCFYQNIRRTSGQFNFPYAPLMSNINYQAKLLHQRSRFHLSLSQMACPRKFKAQLSASG